MDTVILLREDDGDISQFEGIRVVCIPALEYIDLNTQFDVNDGDVLVVTSPRAAIILINQLRLEKFKRKLKIYAMGYKTINILKQCPDNVLAGEGTKDAKELADLIKHSEAPNTKIKFLCGNNRRDVLPSVLKSAGFEVDEIVLYESKELTNIKENWDIFSMQSNWVVFMSPMGVKSFFRNVDKECLIGKEIAAIWSSTKAALIDQGFESSLIGTPEVPTILSLLECIKNKSLKFSSYSLNN
ncbi:tetrapyrrole biosynthesis, uroporphyrinogen III synthase [Rozella allomycis CSF55]|uniref:Tetrapyrrole biosynthesis, uroporphyrinogen III synthase n=1 Tax=Rozella allomycis (strain CSF55) TaxID=988480 RepID=A0A4P9YES7_ROZAC|nr:tetrapyrrole biosynthesis, uroporphyrinogen III synthase [Rozella allomycis CSF55]